MGVNYQGFEIQNDTDNTIEDKLFKAFKKTCLVKDIQKSGYSKAGRTDKGVSAMGNVIALYVRTSIRKPGAELPAKGPEPN